MRRNAKALAEANRTLEQRVKERTQDLNKKNGQLVAGLSHEINNPVGAINPSTDVVGRCVNQVDSEVSEEATISGLESKIALMRSQIGEKISVKNDVCWSGSHSLFAR